MSRKSHTGFFTIMNTEKKGNFQFGFPGLLEIHRNPKVQRANLTCDVIRKVALFVLSKLWILVADWSMRWSRDTFLIKLRLYYWYFSSKRHERRYSNLFLVCETLLIISMGSQHDCDFFYMSPCINSLMKRSLKRKLGNECAFRKYFIL